MNESRADLIRIGKFQFDPDRRILLRNDAAVGLSDEAVQVLEQLTRGSAQSIGLDELSTITGLSPEKINAAADELAGLLGDHLVRDSDQQTLALSGHNSLYSFLEDLRARKVFRVATGYAVIGWLLLQIAEIVFPLVNLGAPAMKTLLVTILTGFPVAVAAAWALELTPAGVVFDWHRSRPGTVRKPEIDERKFDRIVIAALILVVALLVFNIWSQSTIDEVPLRVVAVMPFQSAGSNPTESILCAGFAEEIRVGLDRLPGIRVATRDVSVVTAGGIGGQDIGWLVEGDCQLVDDDLSVTVSLTDTANGRQKWTYSDSRALDELLSFQDDVSVTLALELGVPEAAMKASSDATTLNPRAYRMYLQARGYLSRPNQSDNLETSAELFDKALREDEEFAAAHAGLCEANLAMYLRSHDAAQEQQAESSCLRASQLGPGLPEAHIALGRLFLETGDLAAGTRALRSALKLKPDSVDATREMANILSAANQPAQAEALYREAIAVPAGSWRANNDYGRFLLRRGRQQDAILQFEEAVALTPDNVPVINNLGATYLQMGNLEKAAFNFEKAAIKEPIASSISNYGTMLYYTGHFAQAEVQFRKAAEMSPADHRLRGNIADALFQIDGRQPEALSEYQVAAELAGQRLQISRKDAQALAAMAWYQTRVGSTGKVSNLIDQALQISPQDPEVIYYSALIRLQLGDHDAALTQLASAARAGYPHFLIKASPDLDALVDTPGFNELLATYYTE